MLLRFNSEAVLNAPPSGDEGFTSRFDETFKIVFIALGNGTWLGRGTAGPVVRQATSTALGAWPTRMDTENTENTSV